MVFTRSRHLSSPDGLLLASLLEIIGDKREEFSIVRFDRCYIDCSAINQ